MKPKALWWYISQIVPIVLAVGIVFAFLKHPDSWNDLVRPDSHPKGAGLVENATVVVLVVGIFHGLLALIESRQEIRNKWFTLWLGGWCLALIYFAGEEISWGQWFFKWETPEIFQEINKQKETNLHNTSSWLNQKPRMMVETWLIFAGIIDDFEYIKVEVSNTKCFEGWSSSQVFHLSKDGLVLVKEI